MKKLNVILDETTILNFPFIWTLVKRYRALSFSIPAVIMIFAGALYFSQYEISAVQVGFKYVGTESDSPTTAIVKMLGEKTSELKPEEIISIPNSPDFRFRVAHELLKNQNFNIMNFNSLQAKDLKSHEEIFAGCKGDHECMAHRISGILPEYYFVEGDRLVDTKFFLHVRTLDAQTSNILIGIIAKLMAQDRIDSIKHFLSEQRKLSEELLENKKKEINNTDVVAIKDKSEMLGMQYQEVARKYDQMASALEQKRLALSRQEITHKQTQVEIGKAQFTDDRLRQEKVEALKVRIVEIQNDISALELNKESFTGQDQLIINELKKELRNKKKEMLGLGGNINERSISSEDHFLHKTDQDSGFTEFNYKILQKEYEKFLVEFEKIKSERDKISMEKLEIENQLEEIKPSYEYVKLLESKIMQLKLVEGTVISDLSFENKISGVRKFKKVTKVKTLFFAIGMAMLATLSLLVLRYLMDNRIYDEYELKKNFEDLEIIGNTPNFS